MATTDIEIEEKVKSEITDKQSKKLYVHNDDKNTFDYVIECLVNVCGHTTEQATQCTYLIHYKKLCAVKENQPEDKLKSMQKRLQMSGLTATVE